MLIADNGVGSILVFESCGKLKKKIGTKGKGKGEFKELSSVCIGPAGEIIVADTSRIIVFSPSGDKVLTEIGGAAAGRGRFCGVSVDRHGHLLAAKMEKTKSYIQVRGQTVAMLGSVCANVSRMYLRLSQRASNRTEKHQMNDEGIA